MGGNGLTELPGKMALSHRLSALAEMVTPGLKVCDVGCDHGFLSIYLVSRGICPTAIAMDVRVGPLSNASAHIAQCGLGDYIETRLSDGLEAVCPGEAQSLVCAGMGGRLMSRILLRDSVKAGSFQELILQPQSELPFFRKFLRTQGYKTVAENMIEEEGKFYFLMKVIPTGKALNEDEPLYDSFGRKLLEEKNPVLERYLEYRRGTVVHIRSRLLEEGSERARTRLDQINLELDEIDRAFAWFR